jgi:hypothetical protein
VLGGGGDCTGPLSHADAKMAAMATQRFMSA